MRSFSGQDQFKELSSVVTDSYSKLFPVEKNGHRLELSKIWMDDSDVDTEDFTGQKKVKLAGGTWGVPLHASLVLKDQSGKIIDKMDKVRLATIPKITPRGSYIVGGNEYQIANQMIRKSGAYVVRNQKGELKGMFTLGGDRTQNFDVVFNPTTNKYNVKLDQGYIPLYPLLHSLGATDKELISQWGEQVFNANKIDRAHDYFKLANKLANVKTDNKQTAIEAIKAFAKTTKADPEITEITLGKKYPQLNHQMVLDAATKILNVYKGKATADDPENLLFKEIRSVEDMLHDKLTSKKEQEGLKKMLTRKLGGRSEIKQLIDFRKLTSPVESFFVGDNRSSTPEQYNPVHMVSEQNKLTIHGTGGIQSQHAVTANLREVHPSHIGFIDPLMTPESDKTGTNLHLASATEKHGREIKTLAINAKTGKLERLSPKDLFFKTVAFPDERQDGKYKDASSVRVQNQGTIQTVPSSKVDYVLAHPTTLFSHATNLVPFLKNDQGNRVVMAAKHLGQALSLVDREAPLVQTLSPAGGTFQEDFGKGFSVRALEDGKVTAVHQDYIKIGDKKISLYNNFPLNQKTQLHHTPTVQVGDHVKKGQLLADSNYTKNGVLALGKNLNVAYLPYPGYTFEDGIVITESGAKKLSAEQMYKSTFAPEAGKKELNLNRFRVYCPTAIPKADVVHYDSDGVIKKGTVVKPGQVMIAGLANVLGSNENVSAKRINKFLAVPWGDASVKYSGEFEGVVTDVVKRGDEINVYVKSVEPAKASDKLSGIHGNKGVITKVISDSEAPRTKDGKIPDVFLNPHGVIGRMNLGQIYESAAGKIASKSGKTFVVHNFDDKNTHKQISDALKAQGISDTEEMVTADGKSLGQVHVGNPYILRLAKTGKTGFSARMPRTGYDNNMQPVRGGEEGAKSLDQLTFYSMLSHGAKANLLDAHMKSERNDELWHAIETGKLPPSPKVSFAFDKFVSLLKGAGININKQGSEFSLAPMTDKDTLKLSRGKITDYNFLFGKNMKEIKGGFFDTSITGGMQVGKHYSHMELNEKLPNPVFENAIKSLTNLKSPEYDAIIAGKAHVDSTGKIITTAGKGTKTGGEGIVALLNKIDVDSDLTKSRSLIRKTQDSGQLDKLNRRIRYLKALKDLNLTPEEAYTRKMIPVVPPMYRPIQEIPGRGLTVAPPNFLYQRLGILNESHNHPVMKLLDDNEKAGLRTETYKASRALAGLEAVETRGKDQPINGFLSEITGTTPKQGFFLNKLITKKQDLAGRAVITNGPDLHVDELGIPEKMAWNIFSPFIMKEMTSRGISPLKAREEIDGKSAEARKALETAMKTRTVLMNRAPSLHKFSIMAFKPKLVQGLAIQVPPLVFKGFNADIDGDAVHIHVPVSDAALRESTKMFPSNNLWKPGSGELMLVPKDESAVGIYFKSHTPEGRAEINKILPAKYHIHDVLTASKAKELYNQLAKDNPHGFADTIHKLGSLGFDATYMHGLSASLKDIKVDTSDRDARFKKADVAAAALKMAHKPGPELDLKVANLYEAAAKESFSHMKDQLKKNDSSFFHMINSGASGKTSQLQQMVSAPGIVMDSKDRKIPVPIRKSYAEGVGTADYFMSSYGVRKGIVDRALQTSKPGEMNKDIMAAVVDNTITSKDCGTHKGITLPVSSSDVFGRVLASDQAGFHHNDPVTPQMVSAFNKRGIKQMVVRSPLRCIAPKGTCSMCFGHDENNHLPEIGTNVGATMGQTMSEPVTQMTMRAFHTGGVSTGAPQISGFQRINDLLKMPKFLSGNASLASENGKVTKIAASPAGGHIIHVGDAEHISAPGLKPTVQVGDTVKRGDMLTNGVIRPQELLRYKGMRAAQDYVVDELKKTYEQQGVPLQRKVFETVIRSVANGTRVIHAPGHTDFIPGDIIPHTTAVHYNETRKVELPVSEAMGYHLPEAIGKLPQFHEVTDKDVPYLRDMGYNRLHVLKDPLIHAPILSSIKGVPMFRKNWMAQLGYQHLKTALTEGAAQTWKSNVQDTHPVPAFAYGATFGNKKETY